MTSLYPPVKLSCVSVSKRVLQQNHSSKNEFDLRENEPEGRSRGTHFHINGFARRLVLKRPKVQELNILKLP